MAFDLDRAVRKVERQTGAAVEIVMGPVMPYALLACDPDLEGRLFVQDLGTRGQWERSMRKLHESIYRQRGEAKFKEQKGVCALCGEPMRGTENTEIDHIRSRGRNGRDDRMKNLRVCHGGFEPCHARRHGVKVRT